MSAEGDRGPSVTRPVVRSADDGAPILEPIAPAFRTVQSAAGFAAVIIFFLTLPLLLRALGRPLVGDTYRAMRTGAGPFEWSEQQTQRETTPVDMAFIGTSPLWAAIDTPFMQAELSRALGQHATVITLGYNWRGDDFAYALFRDLLARREVGTVVLHLPIATSRRRVPHPMAHRFLALGHGSEQFGDLPKRNRAQLYGDFVLGAPRHLLSALRSEAEETEAPEAATSGALLAKLGFKGAPFVPMEPAPPDGVLPSDLLYSPATTSSFHFSNRELSPYEEHFIGLIASLALQHHVKVIFLHIPLWSEHTSTTVDEIACWPALLGIGTLVGIPPARLFSGMSESEITGYYYDEHLNVNGARLFTRAVAPALVEAHLSHGHS